MSLSHRVTQADLARQAGVSRSCVSRVVRGLDKVSDAKRERVLAAARELGYIDNGLATALAGNRRHPLVGFLPQEMANEVFVDVFEGLKAELEPQGVHLVVVEGSMDPETEDARLRQLVAFAPDCVVLAGYAGSTQALAAAVHALPIVSVTRRINLDGVLSVLGDDHLGAKRATCYLLGLGHSRVAHLQLPPSIPYEERAAGYREAMVEAGLEPWLLTPRTASRQDARKAVAEILSGGEPPTAILCGSDNMALGVLEALEEAGVSVPGEVSVVGYDDQRTARLVGLTTVDQCARAQGERAGRYLAGLLAGDTNAPGGAGNVPDPDLFEPRLVERSTTAPASR